MGKGSRHKKLRREKRDEKVVMEVDMDEAAIFTDAAKQDVENSYTWNVILRGIQKELLQPALTRAMKRSKRRVA
jgi:AmiR/NasT family two-component response regulator